MKCCVCGKDLGILSQGARLSDGKVCKKCLKQAGLFPMQEDRSFSSLEARGIIQEKIELMAMFHPDIEYDRITIDKRNRLFKINNNVFRFVELHNYTFRQEPDIYKTKIIDGKENGRALGIMIGNDLFSYQDKKVF